jgi:hypothetical protein
MQAKVWNKMKNKYHTDSGLREQRYTEQFRNAIEKS